MVRSGRAAGLSGRGGCAGVAALRGRSRGRACRPNCRPLSLLPFWSGSCVLAKVRHGLTSFTPARRVAALFFFGPDGGLTILATETKIGRNE